MKPADQHLYLMQNHAGCVKIGRSVDPQMRRAAVQWEDACRIEIVAVLLHSGHREEAIHCDLTQRGLHIEGEWFAGHSDALAAYAVHFDPPPDTAWPFALDDTLVTQWRDRMGERRDTRSYCNAMGKIANHLRHTREGDEGWDVLLWREFGPGGDFRWKNRPKGYWITSGPMAGQRLPRYLGSVETALMMWPDDVRPRTFDGGAVECAIAGIKAHIAKARKGVTE